MPKYINKLSFNLKHKFNTKYDPRNYIYDSVDNKTAINQP